MSQYYTIKYIKTKLFKRIYFTTGEVVLKYRILKNHTITDIPEESFFFNALLTQCHKNRRLYIFT